MKIACLSALVLWICSPLFAKPGDGAYQFVRNLYSNYERNALEFAFNGKGADTIFSPELLGLIRLDQESAHGETGFLDWDPLCDCQDAEGLKIDTILVTAKPDTVYARVWIRFQTESKTVVLKLNGMNGKWLIGNIEEKSVESLYEYLSDHLNRGKLPAKDKSR